MIFQQGKNKLNVISFTLHFVTVRVLLMLLALDLRHITVSNSETFYILHYTAEHRYNIVIVF